MSAIICTDLCKYYQQGDSVIKGLDHVSLVIEEGSFICLSGPSGSGKTTLLNAIGGLDTPDSGEIWLGGSRVLRGASGDANDDHSDQKTNELNAHRPSSSAGV